MPEAPDNTELLIECLENWDNAEHRSAAETWLGSRPDMRARFAEQRAVHLALQARPGNAASHQIVREAILANVKEEAARRAVKRSILAAVLAEAQHRSFLKRFRSFFRVRRWALATVLVTAAVICGFVLLRPSRVATVGGAIAYVDNISGTSQLESEQGTVIATKQLSCRSGDQIRVGTDGDVSLVLSNDVRLRLGPDGVLRIGGVDSFVLTRGLLKLQTTDLVGLDTPHLKVIAERGELQLRAEPGRTEVRVIAGKARVGRIGRFGSIDVTNGQVVEFRTSSATAALAALPFSRNVWDWPFSVESPWNTSVGSRAMYARVSTPGWPPKNLTNAVLIRPIIVAGGTNARINLLAPEEPPRPLRYPESWSPESTPGEIVCAIFPADNLCCEMTEPMRLPSGDIRVRERHSMDVLGHGVGWSWPRPRVIAGSAFAGLIRRGELTFGIEHALALAINARHINGDNGYDGHRWPGVPVAPELVRQFGTEGNLALGALLALPPSVEVSSLGVGTAGPGFEIARALQDYGAYVVQTTDGELKLIAAADAGLPPDIDEIMTRLVPHLQLISNSSSRNIGGGGERRRLPAPPLLQRSAPPP
jgi:hypothetical protein